jgi:hypothetical protein
MKAWLLAASGDPALYGALAPHEDVRQAGIALSQYFLPLIAEGKITPRPWIAAVEGERVRFQDGAEQGFDAILFGTGFSLGLDYLSDEVRQVLDLDARHIDLADATFHPDLEGMAFIGFYSQAGPYFPVLELQARLIAYAWSGAAPMPDREALQAGIATYRKSRGLPQDRQMHLMALRFARLAGVEPDPLAWPELARALLFGPLTPVSFRLSGPDALPDAPAQVLAQAAALGAVRGSEFTEAERALLAELTTTSADPAIQQLASL